MKYPKCVICNKAVKDYIHLKHSVTWTSGIRKGQYMHSQCFTDSNEAEKEIKEAFSKSNIRMVVELK